MSYCSLTCDFTFVTQITTTSGNEILLQSDIDFVILEWFNAIKNAIERLVCICLSCYFVLFYVPCGNSSLACSLQTRADFLKQKTTEVYLTHILNLYILQMWQQRKKNKKDKNM